jgi:hypothetical protein
VANAISSDALMQRQIAAIQRQMRQEQRAWLTSVRDQFQWTIGSPIVFPGHITNIGKTPAKHLGMWSTAIVLGRNDIPEFVYSAGTGHPAVRLESAILFPDAPPMQFQTPAFKKGTRTGERVIMTKDLFSEISSGKYFIVMHGKINYEDIFGAPHWQTFCNFFPANVGDLKAGETLPRVVDACQKYNDVDANE